MHLPLSAELVDAPGAADSRRTRWRSRWPTRRLVVAALLTVPLGTVLAGAGGGWAPTTLPLWSGLVALTAALGAATLSTYVPFPGGTWRLDLGCAPCAAVAGLTVVAATWLLALGPHQASMALVAVIVSAAVIGQRLTDDGSACLVDPR